LVQKRKTTDASFHESAKINAYLKDLNKQRFDYQVQMFNDDLYIVDQEFTPYLQSILAKILKANPELASSSVYAFRSAVPNAVSNGTGVIYFTLGLLARLETEDQIAYVLCHELAHEHLKHTANKMLELARLNSDKELNKKVKTIARAEYGKSTKFQQLVFSLGKSINTHSREKEFEADSVGLKFFLKTSYSTKAPVRLLQILDSADVGLYHRNIDFKKHFNFSDRPFKDEWLAYKESEMEYYNPMTNDSLRTHPSCDKRIIAVARQLEGSKSSVDAKENKSTVVIDSQFEIIESAFYFQHYGRALFLSLELLEQYPNNSYLHARIVSCLYQIYQSQKDHKLSNVLSLPSPYYEENYNRFIEFVHKLRLMEVASLAYNFAKYHSAAFSEDEDFLFAYWQVSHTEVSKESPATIKQLYLSKFPKGKFVSTMKNKN
jgi:predicted Zn-dependent protease